MDWQFQMVCSSQCYSKSCSIFLLNIFRSFLMEVFPPLYSPFQSISIVHLFIIQPCTQVSVLLSSFFGLSLPCTSEVYLHCWNFLEGYPSQDEVHFIDIRQVRGGWLSRTSAFEHFSIWPSTMGLSQTFSPPRTYSR